MTENKTTQRITDDAAVAVQEILENLLGRRTSKPVQHEAYKPTRVWSAEGLFLKVNPTADVYAEARALRAAAAAGVPVPKVVAAGDDARLPGGRYFVMTRLEGDELPVDPRLLAQTGSFLRKLHAVPVAGFGPLDAPTASWFEWLVTRTERDLRVHDEPGIRALLEQWRLRLAGVPCVLLHGDIQQCHVRVVDGWVAGFIDFGEACGGDPAWEFAQFCSGVGTRESFERADRMLPHVFASYGAIDLSRLPLYRVLVALSEVAFNMRNQWTPSVDSSLAVLRERVVEARGKR